MDSELQSMMERSNNLTEKSKMTKTFDSSSVCCENKSERNGINIFINPPPRGFENQFEDLFTDGATKFLTHLVVRFEKEIDNLYTRRLQRKAELRRCPEIPRFSNSPESLDGNWKVNPVDDRLKNRRLELGDVSPSDMCHLRAALSSPVQGVQVDFDDGHCPSWENEIAGLHNVVSVVRGTIPGVPRISEAPRLMLRPRAWNMIEKNVSVNGRRIPGPVLDFSLLVYHVGREILEKTGLGACFYLSKLECAEEAKLWNEIFVWSEERLELSRGCLKACVLVENILAAFAMDDILWQLRERSLGLNCGVWDYTASIIAKFGTNDRRFVLPDRNKYVSVDETFLKRYMRLVVKICRKRGTFATGGMAANLLPDEGDARRAIVDKVRRAKLKEIEIGLDGFLVYDLGLVQPMNELWSEHQERRVDEHEEIPEIDLLTLPRGSVTIAGLEHNIRVALLFVFNWLNGRGHFRLDGFVEDSATAEISRSQIWQWIRFEAEIEDTRARVTSSLVTKRAFRIASSLRNQITDFELEQKIIVALDLFLNLVNRYEFPDFITTYLNEHTFRTVQSKL